MIVDNGQANMGEVNPNAKPGNEFKYEFDAKFQNPSITISRAEIEHVANTVMSGKEPTVARIEVTDGDGKTARFFLSVGIRNGRPVAELHAVGKTKNRKGHVTGTWLDFREKKSKPVDGEAGPKAVSDLFKL